MENKLTQNEIARVFAMYWGQKNGKVGKGYGICAGNTIEIGNTLFSYNDFPEKYQLCLTPLDKMTDEHAKGVIKASGFEFQPEIGYTHKDKGFDFGYYTNDGWINDTFKFSDMNPEQWQYLIQKGYAIPLFFGIDHWANGKTAIELGIAIDKTQK